MGCYRNDVAPDQIGDVLPRRGLRFPPDDWGTTSVIWRKSKFRAHNAVPDSVRQPTARHAPYSPSVIPPPCSASTGRTSAPEHEQTLGSASATDGFE